MSIHHELARRRTLRAPHDLGRSAGGVARLLAWLAPRPSAPSLPDRLRTDVGLPAVDEDHRHIGAGADPRLDHILRCERW